MKIIALSLLLLSSTAAFAQRGPFTPAPVPARQEFTISPADRAGRSDSVDSSAPFSASPSGIMDRAAVNSRAVPPSFGGGQTPDVSR